MIQTLLDTWGITELGQGEPDLAHELTAIWLIAKGPPFALRFARYFPTTKVGNYDFYHRHDTVDSIHLVTAGSGFYAVGGKEFRIQAGSIMFHNRGVPHLGPFPDPGGLDVVVMQTPNSGHTSDFIVCPDEGLRGAYRDRAAFEAKYGTENLSTFGKLVLNDSAKKSAKWLEWHKA